MNGSIDETDIFSTALNATQVKNLYLGGIGSLPAITPLTISGGGTLDLNGASQVLASLSDGVGSGVVTSSFAGGSPVLTLAPSGGASTFSGTIQNGSGTVNLALSGNTAAAQWLTGVNTFSGITTVTSGSLVLANSGALLNSTLSSGGIVFDQSVNPHAFTIGGLSGNFSLALQDDANNNVALSVGNNNQGSTYSGVLSGGGSLTKIGSGALTVASSANTFNGGVTLNSGLLQGTGAVPFGTGTLAINGGTLQMLNNMGGFYNNNVTVNSAGTISIAVNGTAPDRHQRQRLPVRHAQRPDRRGPDRDRQQQLEARLHRRRRHPHGGRRPDHLQRHQRREPDPAWRIQHRQPARQ